MSSTLKRHLYCVFSYVVGFIFALILSSTVLRTLCNAILKDEAKALVAARILMVFVIMAVAFVMIYFFKKSDVDLRRAYVTEMKDKTYDAKADLSDSFRHGILWGEVVVVSIVTLLFSIRYLLILGFWPFINIPMFVLFEAFSNVLKHRSWLKEKDKF